MVHLDFPGFLNHEDFNAATVANLLGVLDRLAFEKQNPLKARALQTIAVGDSGLRRCGIHKLLESPLNKLSF